MNKKTKMIYKIYESNKQTNNYTKKLFTTGLLTIAAGVTGFFGYGSHASAHADETNSSSNTSTSLVDNWSSAANASSVSSTSVTTTSAATTPSSNYSQVHSSTVSESAVTSSSTSDSSSTQAPKASTGVSAENSSSQNDQKSVSSVSNVNSGQNSKEESIRASIEASVKAKISSAVAAKEQSAQSSNTTNNTVSEASDSSSEATNSSVDSSSNAVNNSENSSSATVYQGREVGFKAQAPTLLGAVSRDVTYRNSENDSLANAEAGNPKYDSAFPATLNPQFNQNFHYTNPQGYANDVQSIVPHYDSNGDLDYWELYYLSSPYPNNVSYSNQWYGLKTTDFVTYTPIHNAADPTSKDNVMIPDAAFVDANGNSTQIAGNNKNGIPWQYVATGSVITNGQNNQPLLTQDQWGNAIDSNAKLAYFSTFTNDGKSAGIYLAYSNDDQQYHPYSDKAVVTSALVGNQKSTDFRDPFVTKINNGYAMYIAGGLNQKTFVLTSQDGINWTHDSANDISLGESDLNETPNIQTINGQTIMFFSSQPDFNNTNDRYGYTQYVTGHYNDQGIFVRDGQIQTLDDGTDNYAGNYAKIDDDLVANVNWLGDWVYSPTMWTNYKDNDHSGSFTLGRLLQFENGQVVQTPIDPGQSILQSTTDVTKSTDGVSIPTDNKVEVDFSNSDNANKTILLTRNAQNSVLISFMDGKMKVTRTQDSSNVFKGIDTTTSTNLNGVDINRVVVYVDNSSLEIYLPETKQFYTLMDIPNEAANQGYTLNTDQKASVDVYKFGNKLDLSYVGQQIDDLQSEYDNIVAQAYNAKSGVDVSPVGTLLNNANKYYQLAYTNSKNAKKSSYLAMSNQILSNVNYGLKQLTNAINNGGSIIPGGSSTPSSNGSNAVNPSDNGSNASHSGANGGSFVPSSSGAGSGNGSDTPAHSGSSVTPSSASSSASSAGSSASSTNSGTSSAASSSSSSTPSSSTTPASSNASSNSSSSSNASSNSSSNASSNSSSNASSSASSMAPYIPTQSATIPSYANNDYYVATPSSAESTVKTSANSKKLDYEKYKLEQEGKYNSSFYYTFDKIGKRIKAVRDMFIHSNKNFSKKNRVKPIKKGTTIKIEKVERYGLITRIKLANHRFITGLKEFFKRLF